MKRKINFLTAVLLAMLLLVTGCSAAPVQSGAHSPATVTLWHYYVGENQQALEAAVSTFNQTVGMEEGVIVDPLAMGSIAELEEQITNAAKGVINAPDMPQLFSSYPDKAMEIDALGQLVDLNEYFTEEERLLYVDDFLADGIFEGGRLLSVPIVKSTELLYVNATSWNEFAAAEGHSEADLASWESIYEMAKAYHAWTDAATPDIAGDGKALVGFDSVANYIIAGCKQLGVDVIDAAAGEAGAAVLDETALRRVFELYYTGTAMGYFGAVGKFRSDDIKAGALAAYVGSSSSAAYFPTWIEQDNAQQPIEFLPLAYPVFAGGSAYAIQQGAGMCVAKSTPAQQAGAALFLKWFTGVQQNLGFAMTTGYLPVQTAAYEAPAFDDALRELRQGTDEQKIVAGVYEIALEQIIDASTYAAKPFAGSYTVRSVLQATLIEAGEAGRAAAGILREEGFPDEEILQKLDVNIRFAEWMAAIKAQLDEGGIAHTV